MEVWRMEKALAAAAQYPRHGGGRGQGIGPPLKSHYGPGERREDGLWRPPNPSAHGGSGRVTVERRGAEQRQNPFGPENSFCKRRAGEGCGGLRAASNPARAPGGPLARRERPPCRGFAGLSEAAHGAAGREFRRVRQISRNHSAVVRYGLLRAIRPARGAVWPTSASPPGNLLVADHPTQSAGHRLDAP